MGVGGWVKTVLKSYYLKEDNNYLFNNNIYNINMEDVIYKHIKELKEDLKDTHTISYKCWFDGGCSINIRSIVKKTKKTNKEVFGL
jgi:hypothetical protein